MRELVCNLHIHTPYSDGSGDYRSIAKSALKQDVDVILISDHNVLVKGVEGYHKENGRVVLLLTGEEVHDQSRDPQKNHMLVFGANREMATFAYDPQCLIQEVRRAGGLSFLAHPFEFDLPLFGETDISWVDWEIDGFTGLELWNGLSEFKTVVNSFPDAIFYAFLPEFVAHRPLTSTLRKWDELLTGGKKIVAVGGSDAHAINIHKGPIKRTVYPYEFHFSAINNHLLVRNNLSENLENDQSMVYQALKSGSFFIGYDLPASTKGFSFTIETDSTQYGLGETVDISNGATIKILLPHRAHIRLIHNGRVIQEQLNAERLICTITEAGYYRVECLIPFLGKERGWIYSNPVYAIPSKSDKSIDLK
ncbi:MAG: CehA/McbA family metallohydrolase [Chloroflexi bacterium]|nr:CehA/McbA family metallohydrolase [Chloroflexota bacterium]